MRITIHALVVKALNSIIKEPNKWTFDDDISLEAFTELEWMNRRTAFFTININGGNPVQCFAKLGASSITYNTMKLTLEPDVEPAFAVQDLYTNKKECVDSDYVFSSSVYDVAADIGSQLAEKHTINLNEL